MLLQLFTQTEYPTAYLALKSLYPFTQILFLFIAGVVGVLSLDLYLCCCRKDKSNWQTIGPKIRVWGNSGFVLLIAEGVLLLLFNPEGPSFIHALACFLGALCFLLIKDKAEVNNELSELIAHYRESVKVADSYEELLERSFQREKGWIDLIEQERAKNAGTEVADGDSLMDSDPKGRA